MRRVSAVKAQEVFFGKTAEELEQERAAVAKAAANVEVERVAIQEGKKRKMTFEDLKKDAAAFTSGKLTEDSFLAAIGYYTMLSEGEELKKVARALEASKES